MAYGKDKSTVQSLGSFRQKANAYAAKKNEGRSKSSTPFFVGQYKPSTGDVDTIRIIEGHYTVQQVVGNGDHAALEEVELPFFPYTEHYDGRNERSCICSAGPFANHKGKAQPCHGCAIFWSTRETQADGKKKSERMSRREMYAFSVLDYGKYHKMPQIDKQTGQVRTNDSGEPYYNWEKCSGLGCKGCQDQRIESKQGNLRHWALGWAHYKTILETDKEIGKSCRACGGTDSIVSRAWLCPGCGDCAVDMSSTSLNQKQIDELTERPYHCSCKYEGFLQEMIECKQCTPVGGVAARATIFDVDMNVKRIETATGQGKQTALQISRWSPPRPIDPNFKTALEKPLDLPKIYAPTDLKIQAEQFGVTASDLPGPQAQRQPVTSGAARPYSGGPMQQQPPAQAPLSGPPSMGGPPPMGGYGHQQPMQAGFAPPPMQQQQAPYVPPSQIGGQMLPMQQQPMQQPYMPPPMQQPAPQAAPSPGLGGLLPPPGGNHYG